MEDTPNPVAFVTLTHHQLSQLMKQETITVQDEDGDEICIDGGLADQAALQMVADGYPEQLNMPGLNLEISLED